MTIFHKSQIVFQDNHTEAFGGAIYSDHHVTVEGSVQFINNTVNIVKINRLCSHGLSEESRTGVSESTVVLSM